MCFGRKSLRRVYINISSLYCILMVLSSFADLPKEIQSMIWQLCAYNQRVIPLLEDEPYQTTPSFLLACKDAYREGIKGYQLLKTEKHPKSLFNFASDILYISSREPHRELIRHEIEWDNIQNVALEVDSWDSVPKSLGFVYKLPNVKHVHFTCKPALGLQKVVDANEKIYMPPEWGGGRQTTWHLYWRHYWNSRNLKFLSLSVSVWSSDSNPRRSIGLRRLQHRYLRRNLSIQICEVSFPWHTT